MNDPEENDEKDNKRNLCFSIDLGMEKGMKKRQILLGQKVKVKI